MLTAEVCEATGGNPAVGVLVDGRPAVRSRAANVDREGRVVPGATAARGSATGERDAASERAPPGHPAGSDRHRRALRRLMLRRRHTDDFDVCNVLG